MADCAGMKEGELFACDVCGIEPRAETACACTAGEEGTCSVVATKF